MARAVSIGNQDFESIRKNNCFYIDKTNFIKEWWDSKDSVTLIARPRRFGKTLTMSMTEQFFSNRYAGHADLFEGLSIWEHEEYRNLQGTYPVIAVSFANVKEKSYDKTKRKICQIIADLYNQYWELMNSDILKENEKQDFTNVTEQKSDIPEDVAAMAVHRLSNYLFQHYRKKVIILLDEYDTPMQEAYVNGYWEELVSFIRNMFNATFKTNP